MPLPCSRPQENLQKLVHIEHSVRGQGDLLQPGRVSASTTEGTGRQVGEALISPIVQLGWPQTGLAAGAHRQGWRGAGGGEGGTARAVLGSAGPWPSPLRLPALRAFRKQCHWGSMFLSEETPVSSV